MSTEIDADALTPDECVNALVEELRTSEWEEWEIQDALFDKANDVAAKRWG